MAEFPLPRSEAFLGTLDNPTSSQSYRKAVLRPAPSSFTVSIYPPRKQGSNYHYGMRIIPSETPGSPEQSNGRSSRSTKSSKYKEYDIFRRWDDCLDFQRTLEDEYEFISRRRRKGQPAFNHHAKSTLYPAQRAASFDSLPLGPDPSSIAASVHVYIPKLSKKSTLFRMNHATVMRRGEEFKAMIEALLKEDAHSTIQELRTVQTVRDFFALWRRDKEAERRSSKTVSNPPRSPVVIVTQKQAVTQHLTNIVHTLRPSTPKSPNPARNSYATSHTSNNDDQALRSSCSATSFASAAEAFTGTGPSLTVPSFQSAPARFPRSQSVPRETPNGAIETHQLLAHDASSRGKEPLVFLAVPREESAPRRLPIRKGSTPELSRLPPERRLDRDVSPLTRNIPSVGISADDYHPIPTPILSRHDASQRGGSRKATLTETLEELTSITPLASFPFDHLPGSPATPGVVGIGVGRRRGQKLDSLAVLDPELYRSLSAQQALPWTSPPSDAAQVIPRARKAPLILDSAKRSARFFVNDLNHGADLVDISTAPPPRSPIPSTPLTVRPDFPGAPASNEDGEQFDQNFVQRKGLWFAQSALGRLVIPEPHTHDPSLRHGKSEPVSANSVVSGNSTIPTPSSPRGTSLWASQPSLISPPGVYTQRRRSRVSLGSVAERRLSLDSLIASEFEAPYLSRNLAAPRASHTGMSSDAIHMAPNVFARLPAGGRASSSSQETDSSRLHENWGAISSRSLSYGRHGLPPSKVAVIAPKSTPPPRPPRSALRNTIQFPAGVLNESLVNAGLKGEISRDLPSPNPAVVARYDSLIDSYLHSPVSQQALLESPIPSFPSTNPPKSRESDLSYITNFAQYYQSAPDRHESTHPNELDSMPATPFTPSFNSSHAAADYNAGTIQIKAIYAESDIIVLFKVPRFEMTLADLRTELRRKLREAGGPKLGTFLLKYLPPRSDSGTTASAGARKRSLSVASTSHMSSMVDLDNEIEWKKALEGNTKIIMRII